MASRVRPRIGRFGGASMMGGSGNSMMGRSGYQWMMGRTNAPGWMHGETLPSYMMGTNTDPGKVMGQLFADAPGPRVSATDATNLGNDIPAGATVNRTNNRIIFSISMVHFAVIASPAGGPDEKFRIAGLVNPTVVVPVSARTTIELVNADPDTAHGLVVTDNANATSAMPMMTATPAFGGAALWFLGNPTTTGMHVGTITFTASTAGTYQYLCPLPGHTAKGMHGILDVEG